MSLDSLLMWIQDLPLAAAVRGETAGSEWLFPIIETLHVLTLTVVFGSIVMVDLRLVGLTSRGSSISRLTDETLPWTWTSWVLSAITGTLLFMSKAVTYYGNFQFRMKFVFMALAAVNMLIFHFGAYRKVAQWDTAVPPTSARVAGALSIAFWVAVIFFGRWIGFTT
jgi:uncharacterized protein DUF6644